MYQQTPTQGGTTAIHNNLLFSWNNVEQLPEFQRLKLVLDKLPDEPLLTALQQQRGRE